MLTEMTEARWQRITELVNDGLALPEAEQLAYARAQCAGDAALFAEVSQWLQSAADGTEFLAQPVAVDALTLDLLVADIADRMDAASAPGRDWINRRLGAYRITEEIARGGMGNVFRAVRDDDEYQKQVAIKLIRSDMDKDIVAQRFRAERQILANLEHPNIGHLIDGGRSEEGTPYLVMEYVDGLPIDEYCETHALPISERLKLFRAVCSAVHFAHQRLVVHRDLKPSNILVDAKAQVKLLDFGIAKLLDPTVVDGNGQSIANPTVANAMTPAYASPEQIKGEPITTASDVYALGVLLYRLLTGKSPYRNDTTKPLELAKEIVDTDPERPSTIVTRSQSLRPTERSVDQAKVVRTLDTKRLRRELKGDLDTIVLMALRKDAARRYASAEQLGDDISRHLADLPVRARADTWGYRSQKFLSRNRWSAGFVALGCVGLIGGIAATTYQAKLAREAQARSEALFADVRKLANSYLFDVHDAVKNLPGATPVREMLVKNSVAYLDRLSRDASNAPGLIAEIASGYDRLGDVQGAWRTASLGDSKGAEVSFRKAILLREQAAAQPTKATGNNEQIELQRLLIVSYGKLSELLVSNGRIDEGLTEAARALQLSESLAQQPGATVTDQLNVVRGRFSLATQRMSRGALSDVANELAAALDKLTVLQRAHPEDKLLWRVGAAMHNQAAVIYLRNESLLQAKLAFVEALRLTELSLHSAPGTPQFVRMKMLISLQLAEARFRAHELSLAEVFAQQEKSIATAQALSRADPKNQRYANDVAIVRQWVADKLTKARDFERASSVLSESERELVALTKQEADATALANLNAVRLQMQYVIALSVADQRYERTKRAGLCARVTEHAGGTGLWAKVMSEGRPEASLVLPSKALFETATEAARGACSVAAR